MFLRGQAVIFPLHVCEKILPRKKRVTANRKMISIFFHGRLFILDLSSPGMYALMKRHPEPMPVTADIGMERKGARLLISALFPKPIRFRWNLYCSKGGGGLQSKKSWHLSCQGMSFFLVVILCEILAILLKCWTSKQ